MKPRRAVHLIQFLSCCGGLLADGDGAVPAAKRPSAWDREYAGGDWGGLRSSLAERGVLFNFTYTSDGFGVVSGGLRRGVLYNGLLDLGTDVDLEKWVGWRGGHFHVNGFHPHGKNGSAAYVGDVGTFSNIEAYDTWRLYELWVQQEFLDQRVSLRAGQITFDSEFAVLDAYGGIFVQSGFGAPEAVSANLPLPIYPNAAPGARLRIEPMDGLAIQAAAFDGNVAPGLVPDRSFDATPSTEFNRHGTHWALRPEEGALLVGEVSFRVNQVTEEELSATRTSADAREPAWQVDRANPQRGLAGSYEAGVLYATDRFADIYDVTLAGLGAAIGTLAVRDRGPNHGIYLNLEQEVWREPGSAIQGLGAFVHALWMPPDRNLIDLSVEGGLYYRGLIPGRDEDALGLGVAWIHISNRVAEAVRVANELNQTSSRPPDFEATIELVYRYQVAPWFSIQPHAQYVLQPGGTGDIDNALILGLRTNLAF